jgi:hypothetical protein
MATSKNSNQTRIEKVGKAGRLTLPPRPSQIQPKLGAARLLRKFAPPQPFAPAAPPEPQVTDPNPVPALMLAARRLKEAGENEEKCRWQTLGVAFEGAVRAHVNPEVRGCIKQAWQEAEGKSPRMDNFNSLLRHTIALTLMPQSPGTVLKTASFYSRALIDLPHSMRAAEVAKALETKGLKKRASETAERRAALKASAALAEVTSDDPDCDDQPGESEPQGDHSPAPGDGVAATANRPDWVDITMKVEPQTARLLETIPVSSPIAAVITRDVAGNLLVEVAPNVNT